jgi:hypothetical protein
MGPATHGSGSRAVEFARVRLTPLQRVNRVAFLEQTEFARQQMAGGRPVRTLSIGEELVLLDSDGGHLTGTVIEAFQPGGEITYLVAFKPWRESAAVPEQPGPRDLDLGSVGA